MSIRERLAELLHRYIVEYNPELVLKASQDWSIKGYISDKVQRAMEAMGQKGNEDSSEELLLETCMQEMTKELRPSRFRYLDKVLLEEFPREYEEFREKGILTFQLVGLVGHCTAVFSDFGFSEKNQNDRLLRHAIIARVHEHIH